MGALPADKRDAIVKACEAVSAGKYRDQFQVDWYQGGAGTSTNMNANEVLANVALELLGRPKGDYATIDPHDHLNMSQSTNDAYPTALKVAYLLRNDKLVAEVQALADAFRAKGNEYLRALKMGRTELQDAVPMTRRPGAALDGVGARDRDPAPARGGEVALRDQHGRHRHRDGPERPHGLRAGVRRSASPTLTGKPIVLAGDLIAATWDLHGFVVYSGALEEPRR